jgi:mono/diheme cytochrome c family protein
VRLPEINFRGSTVMVTFLLCVFSAAQNTHRASAPSTNGNDHRLIARGKYIVDDVAVCSQCHTPRDPQGNPDHDKWLEGAPVWFQPVQPNEDWPLQAPRIAGTPPGTDAEMITLLTTGIWSNGKRLRPPMPQFRLSIQDAQAVVAYLKSLTPKH